MVRYDNDGKVIDFGAVEIQAVYISGNIREPFKAYSSNPSADFSWPKDHNYPTPDFLSSSRKRLIPQLLYKGTILHAWGKKTIVALDLPFFQTLPSPVACSNDLAEIFWLVYSLERSNACEQLQLTLSNTVGSRFQDTMTQMSVSIPGDSTDFVATLQKKLDKTRNQVSSPITSIPKIGL